jgi:hypothetical protein
MSSQDPCTSAPVHDDVNTTDKEDQQPEVRHDGTYDPSLYSETERREAQASWADPWSTIEKRGYGTDAERVTREVDRLPLSDEARLLQSKKEILGTAVLRVLERRKGFAHTADPPDELAPSPPQPSATERLVERAESLVDRLTILAAKAEEWLDKHQDPPATAVTPAGVGPKGTTRPRSTRAGRKDTRQ